MEEDGKRRLRRGQPPGERHSQARLKESQVREIHASVLAGVTLQHLAEKYGVHVRTIEAIAKGTTWKHLGLEAVPTRRGAERPGSKLTEEDIHLIRARIQTGESISEVARDYRVSRTTISNIWEGKTWKHVPVKPISRRRAWEN